MFCPYSVPPIQFPCKYSQTTDAGCVLRHTTFPLFTEEKAKPQENVKP